MKKDTPAIKRLREISMLAACTTTELHVISRNVMEVRFAAGEVLITEGAPGREFFAIIEGEVEVRLDGAAISQIGPGGFVGEMALLDHGPRTATVVALSEVVALVCTQRELMACLDAVPHLSKKLLTDVASRLRAADNSLAARGTSASAAC